MIITSTNVTIDELLLMEVDEQTILNDSTLKDMENYGMPSIPFDDVNDKDITMYLSDCNNWSMENLKTFLGSAWSDFKKEYLWAFKDKKHKNDKERKERIKKIFEKAWNDVKLPLIQLWKDIKKVYNNVILYFKSNFRKIINLFKTIKNANLSKEEKIKKRKQLKNELLIAGKDVCDMFGIYIIVDFIECSWKAMKNLFGCSASSINNTINSLNEIDECLNELELKKSKRIGKFANIIPGLIQLLAILLITSLAIIELSNAQQKINEEQLNDENEDIEKENDKIQPKDTSLSDLTSLEKLLSTDNNITDNKQNKIISICPVYDNADANILTSNNGYVIEFATNVKNFKISVTIDEDIILDKIIGYINDIPIKSKIEGKVKYLTDRHIIIDKNNLSDNDNNINIEKSTEHINSLLSEISTNSKSNIENEMTSIGEKITNMNNIEILIKDYLYLIYKPIIYGKSDNDVKEREEISFDIAHNILRKQHINSTEKFNEEIKKFCSSDNVTIYTESNNLTEFKNILLRKKYAFIDNIFNSINEYKNKKYYLSTISDDYKMCDYYLDFLTAGHLDNVYYDKLFNIIKDFYIIRYNAENKKKSELIKKFNNYLTDDKIKNKSFDIIKSDLSKGKYEDIKKYLDALYPIEYENRISRINVISNLYILINEIPEDKKSNDNTSLKILTQNECITLLKFIDELKKEYDSYKDVITNITNLYNFINWPNSTDIFINNNRYVHYLFTDDNQLKNATDDDYNNEFSGITKAEPSSLMYWLRYCAMATLENCALPIYWSTGLVIAGAPVSLPIILIPLVCINGSVTTVIGLSICGIAFAPMMLVVNMSDETGAAIFIVNTILEMAKHALSDLKDAQYKSLSLICKPMISTLNEKIKKTEDEIREIKQQIALYKNL